jgi:hypothetical protein
MKRTHAWEINMSRNLHGLTKTSTHYAWTSAKQNCHNPKSRSYSHYGARGIKLCDRWKDSFLNFLSDMGEKPKDKKFLSRIDKGKDFSPENCIWTDKLETPDTTTHGMTNSITWICWKSMKARCSEIGGHEDYYGRGIKVCDRWINSFENFLEDMGCRPNKECTLHRLNGDGNYEPGNVVWATKKVQSDYRSCTRWIDFNGWTFCLTDWAQILGLNVRTLRKRLTEMSIEEAFTKPKRYNRPLNEVSQRPVPCFTIFPESTLCQT